MLQVPVEEDRPGREAPFEHDVSSLQVVRDDTYYMQDGSCVLQVGNTLFNVCRVIPCCSNPRTLTFLDHVGPSNVALQGLLAVQHNVRPPTGRP